MAESVWQLRLVDGTELFADVFDWGDDTGEMRLKNGMAIFKIDNPMGTSYYTLRPFMTGQEIDQAVSVNLDSVIAVSIPHDALVEQYLSTVENMKPDEEISTEEIKEALDDAQDELENVLRGINFTGKKPVH